MLENLENAQSHQKCGTVHKSVGCCEHASTSTTSKMNNKKKKNKKKAPKKNTLARCVSRVSAQRESDREELEQQMYALVPATQVSPWTAVQAPPAHRTSRHSSVQRREQEFTRRPRIALEMPRPDFSFGPQDPHSPSPRFSPKSPDAPL